MNNLGKIEQLLENVHKEAEHFKYSKQMNRLEVPQNIGEDVQELYSYEMPLLLGALSTYAVKSESKNNKIIMWFFLALTFIAVIVAVIVKNPYMLLPYVPIFFFYYFVQMKLSNNKYKYWQKRFILLLVVTCKEQQGEVVSR